MVVDILGVFADMTLRERTDEKSEILEFSCATRFLLLSPHSRPYYCTDQKSTNLMPIYHLPFPLSPPLLAKDCGRDDG